MNTLTAPTRLGLVATAIFGALASSFSAVSADEQRLNLAAQVWIATARLLNEGRSLLRLARHCCVVEL